MRHQVPGLQGATPFPDGFLLVRVVWAQYGSQAGKPFLALNLAVTELVAFAGRKISTRLYCTPRRSGNLTGSCAISATTQSHSGAMKSMTKP